MRLPLDLAIASHSSQTSSPAPLLAFDHGSGELILVELQGHLELSLDGIEMQDSSVASSSTQSDGAKAGQKVGKLDLSVPVRGARRQIIASKAQQVLTMCCLASSSCNLNNSVLHSHDLLYAALLLFATSLCSVASHPPHRPPPSHRQARHSQQSYGHPQAPAYSQSPRSVLDHVGHATSANFLALEAFNLARTPQQCRPNTLESPCSTSGRTCGCC